MRLINADTLLAKIPEPDTLTNHVTLTETAVSQFRQLVEQELTVDPVKHGRWAEFEFDCGCFAKKCSVCGYMFPMNEVFLRTHKYCPSCGAKMDEVRR